MVGGHLVFDRQAEGRDQDRTSGDWHRFSANRAFDRAYLGTLAIELHPDAVLFRTRTGAAYCREPLAHDFADVRALTFPGDKRRLMDMRRSGVVEAVAGDASPARLGSQAGEFDRSIEHAA